MTNSVNHPKHYNSNGREVIEHIFACNRLFGVYFCIGNIIKYEVRAEHKGGADDIAKASWYFNFLQNRINRMRYEGYFGKFLSVICKDAANGLFEATESEYPSVAFVSVAKRIV